MLTLTKLSETPTSITLGWTPPAGVEWYTFFVNGVRVSNAAPVDKNGVVKNSIKFSKGVEPYEVAAICRSAVGVFTSESGKYVTPVTPPPSEWTQVAVEDASFTLTENKEVRYGKDPQWSASKILGPGTYKCDNATFGDPAVTIKKACEARPTTQVPPPPPPPPTGSPRWGVNGSKWYDATHNPNLVKNLGAKIVRHEEGISTTPAALDARFASYRGAGIEVLYQVGISSNVSTAQAQNCGAVAQRHGPNGTKSIKLIEFGNETSYAYQNPGDITGIARNYALRAKEAAISMLGTGVGLLVQIDDALRGPAWADSMFAAVPDLASYVTGWVIHPYGPVWGPQRIDHALSDLARHGDTTKPFYFTEFGLATDNGHTLDDNYGYPKNQTYQQAADAVVAAEAMWKQKCGARWVFTSYYRDFDNSQPGASTNREQYFGIVQYNGSDKGALTPLMRTKFAS